MLWLYVRHRHRHLRDLVVVQTLLPAPIIFGMPIGMTNCTRDADDTVITIDDRGRRGGIEFVSGFALITVDTHIDTRVAALLAGFYLIMSGFDGLAWWWMRLCCSM